MLQAHPISGYSSSPMKRLPTRSSLAWLAIGVGLGGPGCADDSQAPPSPAATVSYEIVTNLVPVSSVEVNQAALPVDPRAKDEILAAAPAPLPPTSPSGTLIATKPEASAFASSTASAAVSLSRVKLEPPRRTSSTSAERDLRSTLHFELVEQCRGPSGGILPPETVQIEFRVDSLGRIDRTSVVATARSPEYEPAARCMARVIRAADARFSSSRNREATLVHALVPTTD